jgi:hypothetical protein
VQLEYNSDAIYFLCDTGDLETVIPFDLSLILGANVGYSYLSFNFYKFVFFYSIAEVVSLVNKSGDREHVSLDDTFDIFGIGLGDFGCLFYRLLYLYYPAAINLFSIFSGVFDLDSTKRSDVLFNLGLKVCLYCYSSLSFLLFCAFYSYLFLYSSILSTIY